jgi:predicted transcriptional regulator
MQKIDLQEDQALVLQQVAENGEEDIRSLSRSLRFDRQRIAAILHALHHKGLIYISQSGHGEPGVSISSRGKRMMIYLWPEANVHFA